MLTIFDIDREKMLGMKNHFDKSGSIEIRKVDIAGVVSLDDVQGTRTVTLYSFEIIPL